MENFFIVLIFIGSIIYTLYSNYKKEIEKTKKRNPGQKPVVQTDTYTESYKQNIPEWVAKTPPNNTSNQQKTNPNTETMMPDEVTRIRESKKMSKIKVNNIDVEDHATPNHPLEFDLRAAVIQAAILERPYQ